ncbi:universal stress protein [Chryseobacterium gotjawalense]|uniref:UspA domain-containing protein n=2 Tax=Chryseobacterium TaxID=59732 RepID=A0A4P6ZHV3_9FLAO|nr:MULTISPECIES: universal stress protein [Chryseobacterium]MDQ0477260.1 nucleotide-binding universal stress UspA family protein [Chryseobacterium sp. MDT2-18]QBO59331.1 hypothetical protein NBC122_02527 [Chryseobacterium salivictor]WHF52492.1 universal stress protein [Chryseobacterium sp. wdc7]
MRTILVPTDFSEPSKNAAHYALNMAIGLKADLHLCNAFTVPAESPVMSGVTWSLYEYPDLKEEINKDLKKFANTLEKKETVLAADAPTLFHPTISYSCEREDLVSFIHTTAIATDAILIVMGMTGGGKLNQLLFGSNSLKMIDKTQHPLLIIPHHHRYQAIRKIAFATDLSTEDKKTAQALSKLAEYFDAELLISHVIDFNEKLDNDAYEHKKDLFIQDIPGKTSYLPIEEKGIDSGLDVLRNKDLDLLVMGHQHKVFFDRLTEGSHSIRQARKLHLPLMVIPQGVPLLF